MIDLFENNIISVLDDLLNYFNGIIFVFVRFYDNLIYGDCNIK